MIRDFFFGSRMRRKACRPGVEPPRRQGRQDPQPTQENAEPPLHPPTQRRKGAEPPPTQHDLGLDRFGLIHDLRCTTKPPVRKTLCVSARSGGWAALRLCVEESGSGIEADRAHRRSAQPICPEMTQIHAGGSSHESSSICVICGFQWVGGGANS